MPHLTDNISNKLSGVFFMKINRMDNAFNVYKQNQNVKKTEKAKGKEDKIDISPEAKEYQFAINKLKDIPEIRSEKVNAIKAQIKSGTYKVDSKKIAEKMIDIVNFDKKI